MICYDPLYVFKGARSAPAVAGRRTGIAPREATADCTRRSIRPQLAGRQGQPCRAGRRLPSFGPGGPRRRRRALTPAADRSGNSPQRQRWRAGSRRRAIPPAPAL